MDLSKAIRKYREKALKNYEDVESLVAERLLLNEELQKIEEGNRELHDRSFMSLYPVDAMLIKRYRRAIEEIKRAGRANQNTIDGKFFKVHMEREKKDGVSTRTKRFISTKE